MFRRDRSTLIHHRPVTLGAVMDVCAVFGQGTGEPFPTEEQVTEANAASVLDVLDVHTRAEPKGRLGRHLAQFLTPARREIVSPNIEALTETARVALRVFVARWSRVQDANQPALDAIEAEVRMGPGDMTVVETHALERMVGSFDPADALALSGMEFGHATRYLAARAAHATIQDRNRDG